MMKRLRVHSRGFGLKGFQLQKKAHDVQPHPFDARHVFADLGEIEALPHIHCAAPWPVVDTQEKASHSASFRHTGCRMRCSSTPHRLRNADWLRSLRAPEEPRTCRA